MIDLNDLMVYLKVVEHGSYTLAAKELGLPKSNISRKVTRLEKALDIQLLARTTRKVAMTELGEAYYHYCFRINEELVGLAKVTEDELTIATGTIKIGCSVAIGQELLAFHLSQFRQKFPFIKLKLVLTNREIDLYDEDFDVVIRDADIASVSSNLNYRKLIDIEMQLFASKLYIEKARTEGKQFNLAEQIVGHDCLCLNTSKNKTTWQLIEQGKLVDISIDSAVSSNDYFVLKTMAEQALGIALLPDYFVEPEYSELVRVFPQVAANKTSIYAFYKHREFISPKIKLLLEYLGESI